MKLNLKKLGLSQYALMDDGKIFRIRKGIQHLLIPARDSRGYKSVRLKNDEGRIVLWKLHRLVAWAFIRPLQPGEKVILLNGIKADCRVQNLRILSEQEFRKAAYLAGKRRATKEDLPCPGVQVKLSKLAYQNLNMLSGGIGRKGPHRASQTARDLIAAAKSQCFVPQPAKRPVYRTTVLVLTRELLAYLKQFRKKKYGMLKRDQALDSVLVEYVNYQLQYQDRLLK